MTFKTHRCPHCGSRAIRWDACAAWNDQTQSLDVITTYDANCADCEAEISPGDLKELNLGQRLFNCCTDLRAPNWSQYVCLTIGGCINDPDDPGHVLGLVPDNDAEFWTVYARDPDGMAEAITDCQTRAEVDAVAFELSKISGLEIAL